MQREIHQAAYEAQKRIESKEDIIVGMNEFTTDEETHADLLKVDEKLEQEQIERLGEIRANRDQQLVDKRLQDLKETAKNPDENLMPHILASVKAYATVGEICHTMRDVFGEYTGA